MKIYINPDNDFMNYSLSKHPLYSDDSTIEKVVEVSDKVGEKWMKVQEEYEALQEEVAEYYYKATSKIKYKHSNR